MNRSIYRIIDANFNRAREAVRVMEEFCRFTLNNEQLTERAKKLRHELSAIISKLDSRRIITSRDTPGDVGAGKKVETSIKRETLRDCLTANCKRLTEALRAIAEMVQIIDPAQAERIERLRYNSYTIEKDIIICSDTLNKFSGVRLYVIVSSNLPVDVISLTQQCVTGGADCIQLRAKDINDDKLYALASEFVRICKQANVLSIINDRVDIAIAAGADGVHLGQNDLLVEQARRLQLTPLIIGKSTHSPSQLESACIEQPTYVSLGPVFASGTKPSYQAVGVGYVQQGTKELQEKGIAHVAIGGITVDNLEKVIKAGAKAVAVSSAVTSAKEPAKACQQLKETISSYHPL
ncbi:MAG: thiamine phosphate synthase [Sedimentisphaerales bacterium]|nr:thiamine phosphate synthase [Sedimentisphaerales bacterium]